MTEQRQLLSECLFSWASQTPLAKKDCVDVMDFLKLSVPETSDGTLDHVTLRVLMSFVVSMDTAVLDMIAEGQDSIKGKIAIFVSHTVLNLLCLKID